MNEKMAQYGGKLTQFWRQMGKKQKIWLGASLGILIIAIVLLTYIFTRTEYEIAFQNLDATDASAIMTYLDSNGIPYKLDASGTNLSVPSSMATETKVNVGSLGLVQNGSIGFEAFETGSSQFGMTENEFNVKYLNSLNGEVQRLLNAMQGVQQSNVLINLPEESVFLSDEEKQGASASITMKFVNGYTPSQKEIDGYYNLVKTAVPNLAVENITISSPKGELVPSEAGGSGSTSTDAVEAQFKIQKKYETDLKNNIQQFLGPIVGSDNLVISVTSSMNFDKKSSEENLVKPLDDNNNNGIIISEQLDTSSTTGGSGAVGGVPGTGETDVGNYTESSASDTSSSETSSQITNYDVNRINNKIESAPYTLKDLSISVGIAATALEGDSGQTAKTEITTYLQSLVRAQLANSGQDLTNAELVNSKVSVIAQNFAETPDAASSSLLSMPWLIGIGAAALVVIAGLVFALVRKRRKPAEPEFEYEEQPAKVEFPTLDFESINDNQARKNLETLAKRKPEEFVNLLRTWLVEE